MTIGGRVYGARELGGVHFLQEAEGLGDCAAREVRVVVEQIAEGVDLQTDLGLLLRHGLQFLPGGRGDRIGQASAQLGQVAGSQRAGDAGRGFRDADTLRLGCGRQAKYPGQASKQQY